MSAADLVWTILLFAVMVQGLFLAAVLVERRATQAGAGNLLAALSLVLALTSAEELVDAANL